MPISDEIRAKMSKARQGKKMGPPSLETRRKISEAQKGKVISAETRARQSAARKGRRLSDAAKKKLSEHWKGREFSEEHRQKITRGNMKPVRRSDGEVFPSIKDAAKAVGVSSGVVQAAICKGQRSGGYYFEKIRA